MKAARMLLLGIIVIASSACATTQNAQLAAQADRKAAQAKENAQYVAAVEAIARKRGVQVVWVNPPKP